MQVTGVVHSTTAKKGLIICVNSQGHCTILHIAQHGNLMQP